MKRIIRLFLACFLIFLTIPLIADFQTIKASQVNRTEGLRVLMMAPEYKKDWGLIRDRNSIAQKFDLILEPENFSQALDQIRKFAKSSKGRRIAQIAFLGHGDVGGGVMDFGGTDVNSGLLQTIQAKAFADADSSLIDAFEDNAEVIFFQCYAGKDPEFLKSAANLFLAFSGGTVYASTDAVASPTSFGNKLLYILAAIRVVDKSVIQHESPSTVSYKNFKSYTLPKFEFRDQKPTTISVEGADFAIFKSSAKLKAVLPALISKQTSLKPFLAYFWFEENKGRKSKKGTTEEIAVDTSIAGLHQIHCQLRIANKIGARVLAEKIFPVIVEEERILAIELSNSNPMPGEKISAKASVKKGAVVSDALWQWEGSGGVRPLATGGQSIDVQVVQNGELKLKLRRIGEFGKIHELGMTSIPINVTASGARLNAPAEVMETDIFSASVNPSGNAPNGKITVSWQPSTIGPENSTSAKLQFLRVPTDGKVTASLNTGNFYEKKIVVKPARFAGTVGNNWEIKQTAEKYLSLERSPSKIQQSINFNGPAVAKAEVGATIEAKIGDFPHYFGDHDGPDPQKVEKELRGKLESDTGELKPFAIGDFKGYIIESKPVFSRGGWGDAGFRSCGVGASGHGYAVKGWATIEVRYNISGSGWFDNRFQNFMESQATTAQAEARAILSGLKLTPDGVINKIPYNGPPFIVNMPPENGAKPIPDLPVNTTSTSTNSSSNPTIQSDNFIKEGAALHDQKKYNEAIGAFTKAINLTPKYSEAYRRRAMSKRELNDLSGAVADFTKAIELDPKNSRAYAGRGLVREKNGDVQGAMTDYGRALELDNRYENAWFFRAKLRYEQKDYAGSLTDYNQVIALNPKNSSAYNNRGLVKERFNNFPEAISDYEQAIALDPNNDAAKRNLNRLKTMIAIKEIPSIKTTTAIGGKTSWGTISRGNSQGDVFAGGSWTNAQNGSDWLQRDFDGLSVISEIQIGTAGSDVTTRGARLILKLQNASGQWITIDELRETNINWEKLSFGGTGHSIPTYRKVLPNPMTAKAFRLEFFGNGWFNARDIKLIGRRANNNR